MRGKEYYIKESTYGTEQKLTNQEIEQAKCDKAMEEFLKNDGEIYQAKPGESGIPREKVSERMKNRMKNMENWHDKRQNKNNA